ncbi:MAG TPA: ABC transporter family substrate-binding protein [Pseudonocardiaceae bacterium]|nr:ABC transporter family substrate-binding protein [Pseudonocardiaceae bacterium]
MVRQAGILLVGLVLLAGCTNMPAVPLVSSSNAHTTTPVPTGTTQVVVAVDGIGSGYNPHLLADQSSMTDDLSAMLLPSVFRTAPDGTPQLDANLMVSAQVTNADPFTVTYQLRTDASWSDGTPVDAADFLYLRNQMSTQSGTVDPAGYQLISNIIARDNGKTIQVSFDKPYPGWRSLFNDLLPAHLLKDAPGGWASALTDSFPATAGPFDIKELDSAGGEITLERSDRYWGTPSVLDQVILRKADAQGMTNSLRTDGAQVAYTRADAAGQALFAGLGAGYDTASVARPELAAVLLRPGGPDLADQTVRTGVAAAIDRNALIGTGVAGGPSTKLTANALVVAPSQAGYAATLTGSDVAAAPNAGTVHDKLTQAGYTQVAGQWSKDGQPLRVRIAAAAGVQPYLDMAEQLRTQLQAAGIQATLTTPPATQLYGQQLLAGPTTTSNATSAAPTTGNAPADTNTSPDIVVGPQPVDPDSASALASQFGCPLTLSDGTTKAPANALGFCDQTVQPTIEAALTGELSLPDALARVEPQLWAQAVEIPLFQVSDELVVATNKVAGVSAGAPLAGPFVSAASWSRTTG